MQGFPFSRVASKRVSLQPSLVVTAVKISEVEVMSAALYAPIFMDRIRSGLRDHLSVHDSQAS